MRVKGLARCMEPALACSPYAGESRQAGGRRVHTNGKRGLSGWIRRYDVHEGSGSGWAQRTAATPTRQRESSVRCTPLQNHNHKMWPVDMALNGEGSLGGGGKGEERVLGPRRSTVDKSPSVVGVDEALATMCCQALDS